MNTNANTLLQASARGHLGTCVVSNSRMYPWLFEHWDCGRVEDDNIDDETIAVRSNGGKTLQSTMREEGGGRGEIRQCRR